MFNFSESTFGEKSKPNIPDTAKVIIVGDMFVEDYVGGAELTTQALIDTAPVEIFKLHSKDVTMDLLQQGVGKFWIFTNFAQMNPNFIPTIVANLRYSVLEYDFKYCRSRSPEKHLFEHKAPCDCHDQMTGKLVSAFYHGATSLWWMSEKQRDVFFKHFPFLNSNHNCVLSSVFDATTLGFLKSLRTKYAESERTKWIVLGSKSWIKGAEAAEAWCKDNNKDYEVVWGLPYNELLEKLAQAEGFVYLPEGGDTCPRMVIEAKLLGCQLELNDNVLHKDEEWFNTDVLEDIEAYLMTAPKTFWNGVKQDMEYVPTISGYTTTLNCIEQEYPFVECIKSMLEFCDEVCVVDGGSYDGTLDTLKELQENDPRVKVQVIERDWNHPRFAVFDGEQKAEARKMCTKEFCWQMDSDEIVHEDDVQKIKHLVEKMPKETDIIALPVVEYWGGSEKIRMDITPWKWRVSRNKPEITHGIPKGLRTVDADGNLCAKPGTDGCDLIDDITYERIPFVNFYTADVENVRQVAMVGNTEAKQQYEQWFNQVINSLPCVFHYSWFDLERKIKLYRDYWTAHWNSLYNMTVDDTAENNMMFDVPWSSVTDEMIKARAQEMKEKLGGWIWHRKWDGNRTTPHITITRSQPKRMQ